MGMCCFDVTRSLTVAGRLWSKDVNRTKTITADTIYSNGQRAKALIATVTTEVKGAFSNFGKSLRSPNYALVA